MHIYSYKYNLSLLPSPHIARRPSLSTTRTRSPATSTPALSSTTASSSPRSASGTSDSQLLVTSCKCVSSTSCHSLLHCYSYLQSRPLERLCGRRVRDAQPPVRRVRAALPRVPHGTSRAAQRVPAAGHVAPRRGRRAHEPRDLLRRLLSRRRLWRGVRRGGRAWL